MNGYNKYTFFLKEGGYDFVNATSVKQATNKALEKYKYNKDLSVRVGSVRLFREA